MRKRPRSSVTTSLANFVGRSVVSAITQTPASGPLGPVTTPPMSPAAALPVPWVLRQAVRSAARTAAAMPTYKIFLVFMNPPLDAGIRMHLSVCIGKPGEATADWQTLGTMRRCSASRSRRSHFSSRAISSDVTWMKSAFRKPQSAGWSSSCSPWRRPTASRSSSIGFLVWRDSRTRTPRRLEELESEFFHAGRSERNAAPKAFHVSRESDPAPSQEFGGGNAGIVGYLAEPDFGGVAALDKILVA